MGYNIVMYGWRGYPRFWESPERLSVLELVDNGTLDLRLAALMWLIMGRRASVLVAAGPSNAGKSTLLNVILDFLPPSVSQVQLSSWEKDYGFPRDAVPEETCLVASEFSNHLDYIWGDAARRAFGLIAHGFSLGGTIHARSPREVVYVLYEYLNLALPVIAQLGAIVNLRVTMGRSYEDEPVRQVESVVLPVMDGDKLNLQLIAYRAPGSSVLEFEDGPGLQQALTAKFGFENLDIEREIEIRRNVLSQLLNEGRLSHQDVRQAIIEFYAQ